MMTALFGALPVFAQQKVEVVETEQGWTLLVDDRPTMVNGMNWDYFPIGKTYNYSLWTQDPAFIQKALDYEMSLLQNMGVNAIRVYTGIQPQWIEYIYENYGIYTMLNHSFGRYGLTIDGAWMPNTDYGDPRVRELLLQEITSMVDEFEGTQGLLLYLLGNENNYGLFWDGAETEDIPVEERKTTKRARDMYSLFNEAAQLIHEMDDSRPVAMANGDLLFLDIIAELAPDIDIFGSNVYRGPDFTDMYERLRNEYNKPVLLTEFGSDAFNARARAEDQRCQADLLWSQWRDIYSHAAGLGRQNNSIGGFTFQWNDGWWKLNQQEELSLHNTEATWANAGYQCDFVEGENNMNEEWWGVMAKEFPKADGTFEMTPRAAYYVLQEAHQFDPYVGDVTLDYLDNHFDEISIIDAMLRAKGGAGSSSSQPSKIRLSRFNSTFTTFNTGGALITTPDDADPMVEQYPNELGFDHMQSFFVGVEAEPAPGVRGEVEFNVLGNVAQNPIDEIFYENRGRPVMVEGREGDVALESIERLKVYRASYSWDHSNFVMKGFYRTGHYHWGYEGDFFGLYPEANYGPQIDIYNGIAPFGFEVEGKKALQGLKVAFGPQLWWGANPAVLVKYSKDLGATTLTGVYHEDIERQGTTESSIAIPQPKTRRVSLYATRDFGPLTVELGGLWAGQPLNDRPFQLVREQGDGSYDVYQDVIKSQDNWGGKVKFTFMQGRLNAYAQGSLMGLVANGGYDQTQTFTGWRLKDSGSGNQMNALAGFTYLIGNLQIAPNFLWQKPIEGPIPSSVEAPGRPRNIIDDPFAVRSNRETIAGELLLTWDPTPGTWMYEWNNDEMEDAPLAISAGIVYRHHPTTQDASIGIFPDGRTTFAFDGAPPAEDLWEAHIRLVSKPRPGLGIVAQLHGGEAQANGSDQRLIERYGLDLRVIYNNLKLHAFGKLNDWGPYDYHRDFNLTYPAQFMGDISYSLSTPQWFELPGTRLGIRGTWRSLDKHSPRYAPTYIIDPSGASVPDPDALGFDHGTEWEIRTYIQISI
jgi:hypothetical protein